MIKVVAKNTFRKDKVDEIIRLNEELVAATRKEAGCLRYELYQDEKDPSILTFIEEWEDQEALDRHLKSEHFLRIVPQTGEFATAKELNIYHKVL